MAAAEAGSAKVVRAILEAGADINQMTVKKRRHAAHEAAKGGHFEVLVTLGAHGAMFDQYDDQMNNPVHVAAEGGHAMCIKYLAQRGNCQGKLHRSCIVRKFQQIFKNYPLVDSLHI